ncbi:MAG: hypothetical protein U0176_05340 [Bacteroidia bacterium]
METNTELLMKVDPEVSGGKKKVPSRKWPLVYKGSLLILNATVPLSSFLLALLTLLLLAPSLPAQYTPLGYWHFNIGAPGDDATGNGNNVNLNANQLNPGIQSPIAGWYHSAPDVQNTAGVNGPLDNLSTMAEVGVEFWIRVRQGNWEGNVHWLDKFQLGFTDRGLDWDVLTATGMRSLHVDLYGVGAADPYTLLGGDWHHVAAFYSSRTGDQRIYIDGVCPPGFFIHHPRALH